MKERLRGVGEALKRGVIWGAAWAPLAVVIGLAVDPDGSMDEMWLAIGAYPGFLCGVLFSALLGLAARGRGIEEVPLPGQGALGAAAGLLVGTFPFTIGESSSALPVWQLALMVVGGITVLSTASAVGTGMAARWLRGRRLQGT